MERLESNPVTRMRRPCRKPISRSLPRRIGVVMNRHRRGESVSHNPPFTLRGPHGGSKMNLPLARIARIVLAAFVALAALPAAAAQEKVLRVAYLIAETNFD